MRQIRISKSIFCQACLFGVSTWDSIIEDIFFPDCLLSPFYGIVKIGPFMANTQSSTNRLCALSFQPIWTILFPEGNGLKRLCFCCPQRRKKDAGIKDSSCLTIALFCLLSAAAYSKQSNDAQHTCSNQARQELWHVIGLYALKISNSSLQIKK